MTDLSYLRNQPDPVPHDDVVAFMDAVTAKEVMTLTTAIITWLSMVVGSNAALEIAEIAQRLENSWKQNEEQTDVTD